MNEISIFNVAKYIVDKLGSMTTMKLQKLTYYCQAWSLAWDDIPLFQEDFQAWANGPVCYELYQKHSGLFIIDEQFLSDYCYTQFNNAQLETIDTVLTAYGEETPLELSNRTHNELPWLQARAGVEEGVRSRNIIHKTTMQEYYGSQIPVT